MAELEKKLLMLSKMQCKLFIDHSLNNLDRITDTNERALLRSDLNTDNDDDRKMKSISAESASQIFQFLKIKDPRCDHNHDGMIKGDELKCLNIIWKTYLPHWCLIQPINNHHNLSSIYISLLPPSNYPSPLHINDQTQKWLK